MKKVVLILALSGIFIGSGITQYNVYYTRNAILQVTGKFWEKPLLGQTKELAVSLDYETTEMTLKLNLNTLEFNDDSLNNILKNELREITFIGELSLDHINTKGHPPLDFTAEGWLTVHSSKIYLIGQGELHHINDSGDYVCMLGITFNLNLDDLDLDIPSGLYEEVEVTITQALLEIDKN